MRQIRSATASNFVPMPPGRFHPHRHLRVPPRHGSARCVAGEGQSRSLERARRHDDEEMAAMAEEPKRDPVRSLSNRIFLTTRESGFGRTPSCGTWAAPRAGSTAIRSSPIRSETGSSSLSSTAPSRTGSATSWPLADSRSRPRAATTSWNGPRSSRRAGPARLSGPISQEDAVTQHPGLRLGAPGSSALTGGIGRQLLKQAVAAVHDVTAVVRNADKLTRQVRTVTADLAG